MPAPPDLPGMMSRFPSLQQKTEPSLSIDVQSGSTLNVLMTTDNGLISDLFFI